MSLTIGRRFEDSALQFLASQGLRLMRRNLRFRGGEVDLIMRDPDGTVVFVEVRARSSSRYGGALASVDAAKRARLCLAANLFLSRWRGAPPPCRFDVVGFDGGRLNWVRDAFQAPG